MGRHRAGGDGDGEGDEAVDHRAICTQALSEIAGVERQPHHTQNSERGRDCLTPSRGPHDASSASHEHGVGWCPKTPERSTQRLLSKTGFASTKKRLGAKKTRQSQPLLFSTQPPAVHPLCSCFDSLCLSDLDVWDVQTARCDVRGDQHGVDAIAEALQVLFSLVLRDRIGHDKTGQDTTGRDGFDQCPDTTGGKKDSLRKHQGFHVKIKERKKGGSQIVTLTLTVKRRPKLKCDGYSTGACRDVEPGSQRDSPTQGPRVAKTNRADPSPQRVGYNGRKRRASKSTNKSYRCTTGSESTVITCLRFSAVKDTRREACLLQLPPEHVGRLLRVDEHQYLPGKDTTHTRGRTDGRAKHTTKKEGAWKIR